MQQEYHLPFTQLETRCWGNKRFLSRGTAGKLVPGTRGEEKCLLAGVVLGSEKRSLPQPRETLQCNRSFLRQFIFLNDASSLAFTLSSV
jgi:hypothetical protein